MAVVLDKDLVPAPIALGDHVFSDPSDLAAAILVERLAAAICRKKGSKRIRITAAQVGRLTRAASLESKHRTGRSNLR